MTDDTVEQTDEEATDAPTFHRPVDTHHVGLVLLALVAVAVLVLAGSLFQRARTLTAPPPAAEAEHVTTLATTPTDSQRAAAVIAQRQTIDAAIAATPDYQRFFDRLKALYPADYDAILNRLATRNASGAPGNPDTWITEAVHRLRISHGVLAAKADAPALSRVFEVQLNMMQALGVSDQHLCVDFLYGTPGSDFYIFAAAHRPIVADMALAGLDAIGDGRQKQIERTPPGDADFALLESALTARGLTKPEIDAILDGKAANPPIDDARMCTVGQIYLEQLAGLPQPVRMRIYGLAVALMARS